MNLNFKQGRVVSPRSLAKGNFFTVRVIPDMEEILEEDLLPTFPNFFSENDYSYQKDDVVWLLTNEDYNVGFILGLTQPPAGEDITDFVSTINFAEQKAGFELSGYNDLAVKKLGGKSITFINTKIGTNGTIYNSRTVMLYGADGSFWFQNPSSNIAVDSSGNISITGRNKTENLQDITVNATGISKEEVGSKVIESVGTTKISSGGSMQVVSGSNKEELISNNSDTIIAGKKTETLGKGESRTIVTGGKEETVLLGDYSINVVGGSINLFSTAPLKISSATMISLASPIVNLPSGTGVPFPGAGLNGLPFCLFTGVPHGTKSVTGV